jgi:hypothetical protein
MKFEKDAWKVPVALGMILCSLVPVVLLYAIDSFDLANSVWAFRHLRLPPIAETFLSCYRAGFVLPILTTVVAIWFVTGKSVTAARLSWAILLLIVLHLFWLSWGILAFYLANQKFVMF